MYFVVPLSLTISAGVVQVLPVGVAFCCKRHPGEGDGQDITAVFVGVWKMVNEGAPAVDTANNAQNPPVSE